MSSRARTRAGFTLVELLVVIGVIALLLAVLLPSLARAREQAKAAACLSNVKQLATALNMYANDHQIFIFYGGPGFDRKALLYPYLRLGKTNADNTAMSVWNCPANLEIDTKASYGFNTKLNKMKYATIRRPSEKVALADAGVKDNGQPDLATHLWSPGTPATASSCRPDHLRHPKQMVMTGFVDGHAEPMPMKPPFYPGPIGHPQIGNGVTDPADANFLDRMWVKD
jgi:prepilin-type N-terminal cleavage/methylation domain-containing protein/prepilin-type processing-associated H-X9-DG protein